MSMTWEAFRLTSKSPSEVLHVLGPHGVDDLIIKMRDAVWREYPEDQRTFPNVKKRVGEVFARNMKVWSAIRKPTPAAFFENLLPYAADGYMRQALVLAWMMLPRAGGRDFKDVRRIVSDIYDRNMAAWEQDHATFTGPVKKRSAAKKLAKKPAVKKKAPKKTPKKRVRR